MRQAKSVKTSFKAVDHQTWQWKVFLLYDALMMLLIICNLLTLALQAFILSAFGGWVADVLQLSSLRLDYMHSWYRLIQTIDFYFICYLIAELAMRWAYAIVARHHHRWWYFPFIHWYEVLAIIPQFRFLRLARALIIAYRLHELGYQIVPQKMIRQGKFYYDLILEELSDRIVLSVIKGVENELQTSTPHNKRIHHIINQHRHAFAQVLAETLQHSVAQSLTQQQQLIQREVGLIVHQAIANTPELRQLLRLLPLVGPKIEEQLQVIGQRIGENISEGLIDAFRLPAAAEQVSNPLLQQIAQQISQIPLDTPNINALLDSVVAQSFVAIREQVKIKQWQQKLAQTHNDASNAS
jgi:hypothetical protein